MDSKRGKLNFLVHPGYESMSEFHREFGTPEKARSLEIEQEVIKKWERKIDEVLADSTKVMVIFSPSTSEKLEKGEGADQAIVVLAQKKLGNRCIVLNKSSEYGSLYQDTDEHARQLVQELIKRGIVQDAEEVKEFSSVAFGEWSEGCVVSVASQINQTLGLKRKTRIRTKDSLGVGGVNDQSVNSNTRRSINEMKMPGVVVEDK